MLWVSLSWMIIASWSKSRDRYGPSHRAQRGQEVETWRTRFFFSLLKWRAKFLGRRPLKASPGVQVHLLRLMSICLVVQRCPSRAASASVQKRELSTQHPHSSLNFQGNIQLSLTIYPAPDSQLPVSLRHVKPKPSEVDRTL